MVGQVEGLVGKFPSTSYGKQCPAALSLPPILLVLKRSAKEKRSRLCSSKIPSKYSAT